MILAAQTVKINLFAIYEVLLDFYTGCVVEQHNLNRFSWLHISDLGLSDDDQSITEAQWQALQEDLRLLHPESGPWDAVFLTGDITGTAKTSEYLAATPLMKDRILATLNELGSSPIVLSVPGNHDLQWLGSRVEARLLRFWSQESELREEFWEDSPYLRFVREAFKHYLNWATESNLDRPDVVKHGIIPGDFSTSLSINGLRIGVVGLNTVFTQFPSTSSTQKVSEAAIHYRQLTAVCGSRPEKWTRQHNFNLLLTHSPPSSLDAYSRTMFRGQIAVPGRFDVHLCGSLHKELNLVRTEEAPPLLLQAPPFFGPKRNEGGYLAGSLQTGHASMTLTVRCRKYESMRRSYVPDSRFDPKIVDEFFVRETPRIRQRFRQEPTSIDVSFRVEQLELLNFRNFEHLTLSLNRDSSLAGDWTCLAGINGAGKSSILQSLALIFLGEPLVRELGGDRLSRMRRLSKTGQLASEVRAWVNHAGKEHYLELKLDDEQFLSNAKPAYDSMLELWNRLRTHVVLAYGATRNISDYHDTRYSNLSPDVARVMTLFDPLAQITSAETLLIDHFKPKTPVVRLFKKILAEVFDRDLGVQDHGGTLMFTFREHPVDALNLPDGFRSSVAWLIDLCAAWCEKFESKAAKANLSDIEAIVLIDEIDLHLHPSLQRVLVPRLRKALPKVQWIVTTHSPLILSSFDSAEIVALDRDEPTGIRFLDRQILGFSTDQIYNWLMETSPTSAVMEQKLSEEAQNMGPDSTLELAQLLEVSPTVNTDEALRQIRDRQDRLQKLKLKT